MADLYDEQRETLARLYAKRMGQGFGANLRRKLEWTIRDAEAAGDRQRAGFWQQVRQSAP